MAAPVQHGHFVLGEATQVFHNQVKVSWSGIVMDSNFRDYAVGSVFALVSAGGEARMLWLIFLVLIALWFLGMVTSYTLGGFLHVLLILAIGAVLIRVIQGRSPL